MVQLIFYQFFIREIDDDEEEEDEAAAAENKIERLPVIKFPFCCPPLKIAAYFIRKIFLSANNKKNCRTHTVYRSVYRYLSPFVSSVQEALFLSLVRHSPKQNGKYKTHCVPYHTTHARTDTHARTRGMRRYFDEYK